MFETTHLSTKNLKDTLDVLRAYGPEDFQGHTEFYRMSAQQRLAWLDGAVAFIREAENASRKVIQDSESPKT